MQCYMLASRWFANGARAGRVAGQGKRGNYRNGDDIVAARKAAQNIVLAFEPLSRQREWIEGYRYGYRLAVEGREIEAHLLDAPIPHFTPV